MDINKAKHAESTTQQRKSKSKSAIAYDIIRKKIMTGEYEPGTQLPERQLQEKLHFSRTPIKMALERLAFEGYIESTPDKVSVVTRIGFPEVIEIYELRVVIEALSVRLAATRRTDSDIKKMEKTIRLHEESLEKNILEAEHYDAQFHMEIASASQNKQIGSHLKLLIDHARRASIYQNITNKDRVRNSIEQHKTILKAITDMDPKAAETMMSDHLQSVITNAKNAMVDYYFMYR